MLTRLAQCTPLPMIAASILLGLAACSSGGVEQAPFQPNPGSPVTLTPQEPFTASALVGDVPSPSNKSYQLQDAGTDDVGVVMLAPEVDWVTASPSNGVVPAGGSMTVDVALDETNVIGLTVGNHLAEFRIVREGSTEVLAAIDVQVNVDDRAQGFSMNLQPPSGLSASGVAGGTFGPAASRTPGRTTGTPRSATRPT